MVIVLAEVSRTKESANAPGSVGGRDALRGGPFTSADAADPWSWYPFRVPPSAPRDHRTPVVRDAGTATCGRGPSRGRSA